MRILHSGDWHLGIDLYKCSMIEDQWDMKRQLQEIVVREQIDVVLIAGDVYDTILASREAIEAYDAIISMLCMDLKVKVIVIAGNHDSPPRLAAMAQLMAPMGYHVCGSLQDVVQGIEIDDCIFYPIPYFHVDQVRQAYGKEIQTKEEAYACICEHIRGQGKAGKKQIVIAHGFVGNAAVCESDRFADVGGLEQVSASLFEGFAYVALGHLHRQQQIKENIWYSGSPLPYSFSEANQEKGMLIYDSVQDTVTTCPIQPLHPLYVYKGTFHELDDQMKMAIDPQGYYKLEVSDRPLSYELLDYFRQGYSNQLLQLSGKVMAAKQQMSVELNELDALSDVELVRRFFADMDQSELFQEEEKALFLAAMEQEEDCDKT